MPRAARSPVARAAAHLLGWLVAAAVLAGCGENDESQVPAACRAGAGSVLRALEEAPDPVRLEGEAPISACFARQSDVADMQTVGAALTEAASRLAREARSSPEDDATLELGYLIGAARRGAEQTPALYDELLRRLESELRDVDTTSEAFRTGEQAGRVSG